MTDPINRLLKAINRLCPEDRIRLLSELQTGADKTATARDGVYKRGRTWWITYTLANGQRVRESAKSGSQDVARRLLALRHQARDRETLGLPKAWKMTFQDAADRYLASPVAQAKRSKTRDQWCARQLVQVFGHLRLVDIGRPEIDAFMTARQAAGVTGSTVNRSIALLSAILGYATEIGEHPANQIRNMRRLYHTKAPDRRPTLSTESETRMLDACPQHLRDVARFALATGCRLGEVLALDWRHLSTERNTVEIEVSKGGEGRTIPLPSGLVDELVARRGTPGAPVFCDTTAKRATLHGIGQCWRVARARAIRGLTADEAKELADLRIHDLRHVFARRAIARGMSLFELSKILGHTDPSRVTSCYADTTPERMAELVDGLPLSPAIRPAGTVHNINDVRKRTQGT